MMSHKMKSIIFVIVLVISSSLFGAKIAVATKVNGTVELQKVGERDFGKLKPGTILDDGDRIRTGSMAFAAIIFIDDKSTLKLKENSEIVVTGKRSAASIAKKIDIDEGTLRAIVTDQRKGEFIIQTPTSVASVKGTDFWLIVNESEGDQVLGLEGIVNLLNIETGLNLDVTEGNTGTSTPDGQVNIDETNTSNIPIDPEDDESEESQIRIYFEVPNGEQKSFLINYL